MQTVSIIIPNYNGRTVLKKNIPAVVKSALVYIAKTRQQAEIIVIDDGSHDDSIQVLEELKDIYEKKIVLSILQNKKNLGFSSTVNKGVKHAKGDLVVLLNTDVRPTEDFLFPLAKHFKDEKVFGVGCLDKSIEGDNVVLRGRGIGYWRQGMLIHSAGALDKATTLWVSGGSSMFRKSIWEELGGFNELMNPFYWEDIDLSYRAQKAGYLVLFEKESVVTHKHEEGAIKTTIAKKQIQIIAFRNQYLFTWSNLTDKDLLRSHMLFLPYHLFKAVVRLDTPYIFGFLQALMLLPKILSYRKNVTKKVVRSDKSLQLYS